MEIVSHFQVIPKLVTKQLLVANEFHSIFFHNMEVNEDQKLVSHIFQNIFFYVQQKKEDLDQLEGELNDDGIFIFWWTVPLTMEKFIRKIVFSNEGLKPFLSHTVIFT